MNRKPSSALRCPTNHDGTSFVSASIAVHVHTSPTPNSPLAVRGHVLRLRVDEGPNLVALDRLAGEIDQRAVLKVRAGVRRCQAGACFTVLKETSASRAVARMLLPSTSSPRMAARFSVLSRFILNIMPERSGIVKRIRGGDWPLTLT